MSGFLIGMVLGWLAAGAATVVLLILQEGRP